MWQIGHEYRIKERGEILGNFTYKGCKLIQAEFDEKFEEWIWDCTEKGTDCKEEGTEKAIECHVFTNEDETVYELISRDPDIQIKGFEISEAISFEGLLSLQEEEIKCAWDKDPVLRSAFIETFNRLALKTQAVGKEYIKRYSQDPVHAIKSGSLTGKVTEIIDGFPKLKLDSCRLIKNWYEMAEKVSGELLQISDQHWCFYRTMKDDIVFRQDEVIQPIPSSYTTSFNMAKSWLMGHKCCIIKIYVPMGTLLTFLDKFIDDENKSQSEVVLPAGVIHINDRAVMGNIGVVLGVFEPWDLSKCMEYVNEHNIRKICFKSIGYP